MKQIAGNSFAARNESLLRTNDREVVANCNQFLREGDRNSWDSMKTGLRPEF
jgi:hypothetical protein